MALQVGKLIVQIVFYSMDEAVEVVVDKSDEMFGVVSLSAVFPWLDQYWCP